MCISALILYFKKEPDMEKLISSKSVGMKGVLSLCLFMFLSVAAFAQLPQPSPQPQQVNTSFSDQELETFVDVYVQVVEMQQEIEMSMMQAIEEENIALERFNEILQAQQNQQSAETLNASAEELAAFNNAAQKIMEVQKEAQVQMQGVIDGELGLDKYQQIVLAYQQSPDVQEKVNTILQQKMEEVQSQQPQQQR